MTLHRPPGRRSRLSGRVVGVRADRLDDESEPVAVCRDGPVGVGDRGPPAGQPVDGFVYRPGDRERQPAVAHGSRAAPGDAHGDDPGGRKPRRAQRLPVDPRSRLGRLVAVGEGRPVVEQVGEDCEGGRDVVVVEVLAPGHHCPTKRTDRRARTASKRATLSPPVPTLTRRSARAVPRLDRHLPVVGDLPVRSCGHQPVRHRNQPSSHHHPTSTTTPQRRPPLSPRTDQAHPPPPAPAASLHPSLRQPPSKPRSPALHSRHSRYRRRVNAAVTQPPFHSQEHGGTRPARRLPEAPMVNSVDRPPVLR